MKNDKAFTAAERERADAYRASQDYLFNNDAELKSLKQQADAKQNDSQK